MYADTQEHVSAVSEGPLQDVRNSGASVSRVLASHFAGEVPGPVRSSSVCLVVHIKQSINIALIGLWQTQSQQYIGICSSYLTLFRHQLLHNSDRSINVKKR